MDLIKTIIGEINGTSRVDYCEGEFSTSHNVHFLDKSKDLHSIKFPDKDNVEGGALVKLKESCDPASFGMKGKEVLDDSFRRASVMFNDNFIFGICLKEIESIIQSKLSLSPFLLKVDKLNVYSEGGFFEYHHDTPQPDMIGTLLICLPTNFEGGDFVIKRNEEYKHFEWSKKSNTHFQWVAFFSDILHKVEEVTKGNRITITYSIVIRHGIPKSLIENTGLVLPGMEFGYFCNYLYSERDPKYLKGEDYIIYNRFINKGFKVEMCKVLVSFSRYFIDEDNYENKNKDTNDDEDDEDDEDEEDDDGYNTGWTSFCTFDLPKCMKCKKPSYYFNKEKREDPELFKPYRMENNIYSRTPCYWPYKHCLSCTSEPIKIDNIKSPIYVRDISDLPAFIPDDEVIQGSFGEFIGEDGELDVKWLNKYNPESLQQFSAGMFIGGNIPDHPDRLYGFYALVIRPNYDFKTIDMDDDQLINIYKILQ